MKKSTLAALLGATLLTAGTVATVNAQTAPQDAPKHRMMMRDPLLMADANKDGVVTREEMTASVAARFAKLDTNKDGTITLEERLAARAAMREKMGKPMHDGKEGGNGMRRGPSDSGGKTVTLADQTARALKRFDFVDRNGDGKVDQAERELVRSMMREMGGGRGHHGRRGMHHGGGDMPPPPPPAG